MTNIFAGHFLLLYTEIRFYATSHACGFYEILYPLIYNLIILVWMIVQMYDIMIKLFI